MRIIYADQDKKFSDEHRTQLLRHGHEVVCVKNCSDVILNLKRRAFDLVITDAGMPGNMTGISLLKMIKRERRWKHLPVLVFIGDVMKKQLVKDEGGIFVGRTALFTTLRDAVTRVERELELRKARNLA